MNQLDDICCSSTELPMVVERVAQWAGACSRGLNTGLSYPLLGDAASSGRWIESVARRAGLEAEEERLPYRELRTAIKRTAPLVLRVADSPQPLFIVIAGSAGKTLVAVSRELKKVRLHLDVLRDFLFRRQRLALLPELERLLEYAEVSRRRRNRSLQLLLNECLADARLAGWTLRLRAGSTIWRQARSRGLPGRFGRLIACYGAAYVLWLLSWWVLGSSALQGRFDRGWIGAWALLLVTMVPLRMFATWMQGVTATGAGWVCRQKLLYETLRLDPDEMRSSGIGHFLGRALELEAIETAGLTGGVIGVVALIELVAGGVVLAAGAAPALELLTLVGWSGAVFALLLVYLQRRRQWTGQRLEMTHDLVERIVGHRTRIIQQTPERWHAGEDEALEAYLLASRRMDRVAAILNAFAARGLVLACLLVMASAVVGGSAGTSSIAITLGGALIAGEAIRKIAGSFIQLADSLIAWQRIRPLLGTGAQSSDPGEDALHAAGPAPQAAPREKLIEFSDVEFRHRGRREPVLERCRLSIFAGDKLLLEGPSGSGKSTLAALLAGLRPPGSGLLLLNGMDWQTLGLEGWRREIATAPQYHENHVFSETFAFNLLMGRRWPASAEQIREAEGLCRRLGLGELLDRMPAGLMQMVGESGWQLSHGERSRLFIARALLQGAGMVVLDESFAALDPDNLRCCVQCALEHSNTLLVVAHP
ncbi:MAG: ABC transporter ATP-binding protein [Acidobacteria bacterium]|nr:ABC transporter ATP-binding protein [Acidobacteriota bacterium]